MSTATTESTLRNLHRDDLSRLANTDGTECVSLLMRTHRKGRETQQDPIRFGNLLNQANEQLKSAGRDASILQRIESLQHDTEFWRHQGDGLAIFVTKDQCHLLRLNRHVDETVHVGDSFFLSPLVCEHNAQHHYFVLALSWDESTLHHSDGDALSVVETQWLPAKFDELVLPRDPEEALQNTSHRVGGNSVGMFHGQGEGEDKIEADRNQYLSIVGDEVSAAIYNTGKSLVIAATSEVAGHFAAASGIEADAHVDGSPSTMNNQELQDSAHQVIAPKLGEDQAELMERFGTAQANSQGSSDTSEIIEAAKQGKIDTLFICNVSCEQTNLAVLETIRTGGNVYRCDADNMPGAGDKFAAIFRYH
ncbi:hypothetical protein LF1_40440 [Rubripirellula obstinata]|uniref:Uncharacterized protein n=1 Tax=Rubripirellula obstinata TaxID=406547 RepID=A0A5B1CQI8_9BACT|nr:hypothetical protein [Rubripirellula obstinata]KAA1261494.1 hypothetical protein LF1_40440 [Rubripirellula obstinata]